MPSPTRLHRAPGAGEVWTTFHLVYLPEGRGTSASHFYVRKGASPTEKSPWVRILARRERSHEVHRFASEDEARAWCDARREHTKANGRASVPRFIRTSGPVLEGEKGDESQRL